jgi:hypothetical protein
MDIIIRTSLSEGSRFLYLIEISTIEFASPGKLWPDFSFICSETKTAHAEDGSSFGGDNKAVAFNALSSNFALVSASFAFWASVKTFLTRALGFAATFFFGFAFGFAVAFFAVPRDDFLVEGFPAVSFFVLSFGVAVLAVE